MIIQNSAVNMASSRTYSGTTSKAVTYSNGLYNGKNTSTDLFQTYLNTPVSVNRSSGSKSYDSSVYALKLLLLRRIFDSFRSLGLSDDNNISFTGSASIMDLRSSFAGLDFTAGTLWHREISTHTFFSEKESTTFSATGCANTADGRSISFGVELSLSRSFTAEYDSFEAVDYFVTDPLMISLSDSCPSVSDVKFMFDLDKDGDKEEISFAGESCGFLALDKNGDGVINDGGELFGTKSGNGFSDLSEYDEDNNGWIDEADSVFNRLRVWTKDENGKDKLIDLKSADVGAIYLGSSNTEFSMNDSQNHTNAILRSTGIYLKESGGTGIISQIDLTSSV